MVLAAAVAAAAIDGKELGTGSNFYWKSPKTKLVIVYPVVALNSAHGFTQHLPREGRLSIQCRHTDQSESEELGSSNCNIVLTA